MVTIDKNIPIPAIKNGRHNSYGNDKYSLLALEVGDSVFHEPDPAEHLGMTKLRDRLVSSMYAKAKKSGRKFTYRAVPGGYRVWRTA